MTETERKQHGISDEQYVRLEPMRDHDLLIRAVATIENMQATCTLHKTSITNLEDATGKLEKRGEKQGVRLGWIEKLVYAAWGVLATFATLLLKGDLKP